ncbi:MAG: aminoacyl-histidine dipeptidase [Paludibacteraceae bacterium]|nr:aminoacyl-histidine dipeptidase [Paludibacteraceae bacterium]
MEITDLEPKRLWKQFYDICQIPRPSKKEEKMIAFLQNFGKEHNLDTMTDACGNVLIRKPATPGYENKPCVVLQSHMDMVCEKNSDTKHNFDTDPIQTWIDGEWVKAKGTTLGGDDGIGCATELAILASDDLKHPALECLFTRDEETGLTGAFALDPNLLKGELLINLDSEDDGQFFIGCAGGIDTTVTFDYKQEAMPEGLYYFELKVNGLKGGHSGGDIHLGRGNANKVLNRIMWMTMKATNLHIAEISGGNLRNAIAREARAVCAVPASYRDTLVAEVNKFAATVKAELSIADPDVNVEINTVERPAYMIDGDTARRLIQSLYACPHGVIRWSDELEGIVETSTNLAAVKMIENNQILVTTSQRSLVDSCKRDIANQVEIVFTMAGAKATHGDGYPGWKPNANSKIANALAATYKKLFSKEPQILAIHAGLECGLFLEKYPKLDMVSVGPTMVGVHSPDEKLHIPAVQDFWKLIVYTLENI